MVKVDLVHDPVAQSYAKQHIENVVVDPPEEILANKLCTLLQRSLLRDLVDVMMLEKQGYRVDEALPVAMKKEGALDAATLAVRLNGFRIGRGEEVPGGVSASELERYVEELVERLSRLAFPSGR